MPARSRLLPFAVLALATVAFNLGCGGGSSPTTGGGDGRVKVVATTTQLGDFARTVGGNAVAVTQLLQPNADPHEYEPTVSDVAAVADADVILENGLGLDDWLDSVIANAGGEATRVVTTGGLAVRPGDEASPAGDPHAWLDPRNAVRMVRTVEAALATVDPADAGAYAANADAYVAKVQALDAKLAADVNRIPVQRRKIVTDHDAFGYFADRYDITIVGTVLPSLATAAEPSAKDLAELSATIRREGVRAIFAESSVDPKLQKALAEEAGIRLGAPLYGDTLGPADSPGGTYLGMMRWNMDAIVAGITAE